MTSHGIDLETVAKQLSHFAPHEVSASLRAIADLRMPTDLFYVFVESLKKQLVNRFDAPRVVKNLQRFLQASRSPQAWLALFEREPEALPPLLQLFSASQHIADLLIADPEAFDLLRMTGGEAVERSVLQDEILAEISAANDLRSCMKILRNYRHREMLRIAFGDFLLAHPLELIIDQLGALADVLIEAAMMAAWRDLTTRRPPPPHADGRPISFAVIALGKLGGNEMDYSSEVEIVFVHETVLERPGGPPVREAQAEEFFQRLVQSIIRLLSESTVRGAAYQVDLKMRPFGSQGPLAVGADRMLDYFEASGRTWERQAFIKARAVAGDLDLGGNLIAQLQPWIYRRYLMRADITGLEALKRRIKRAAEMEITDPLDIYACPGAIRETEQVVQFLQLLHGGDDASVRSGNTLDAIDRLATAGCITDSQKAVMLAAYRMLRRIELFIQTTVSPTARCLPENEQALQQLAERLASKNDSEFNCARPEESLDKTGSDFNKRLREQLLENHSVLETLLDGALEDERGATAETDLVLDPEPPPEAIQTTLAVHGFADCNVAYRNLQALSVESIEFLSTRRCRHFLAAIASDLLRTIASTPSPDATLNALANVSDSLGGKAVLWELFSVNPPSMELCVRLCACSPYLAGILTSNPGMIDELMDSLMLDGLPTHDELAQSLAELCHGAVDISQILASFKNSMHLRVGVREILGKSSITETHVALASIAEVCLEQVVQHEFHRLIHQLGLPTYRDEGSEKTAELVVLAVGKLGGREPNYHSDLDVIFLFDHEGHTRSLVPNRRFEPTTNRHFFNQLCQRIIHAVTRVGSSGKLYDLDVQLRPLGRSGELAITIDDLKRYFSDGGGQVWERQALCKARPIWGAEAVQAEAMQAVGQVLTSQTWTPAMSQQLLDYRSQTQSGAAGRNLKRSAGGTMDIEFVIQLMQMAHAQDNPRVLTTGTFDALEQLRDAGYLEQDLADRLAHDYRFLRRVESGIRLMNMSARHDLPTSEQELNQLSFLLNAAKSSDMISAKEIITKCEQSLRECREIFDRLFERYATS